MIIRKQFKFEGSHIVRDCTSHRCSHSVHGHSYIVEIFLTSDKLDNGGMIVDFGLLKGPIGDLIDSFDHAFSIWNREDSKFLGYQKSWSERFIIMPASPSAENYSLMFLYIINKIIKNTEFNNGEGTVEIHSVRVHETATGYAEAFKEDLKWIDYTLDDVEFSEQVQVEWKNKDWLANLKKDVKFINPKVELKYQDV